MAEYMLKDIDESFDRGTIFAFERVLEELERERCIVKYPDQFTMLEQFCKDRIYDAEALIKEHEDD